jgi:RNA polymerase sigma-70 factor (ECF subfamily)
MSDREERFMELVRENAGRLRRICRVYADGAAAEEDLYQDILLELWRSLPSFQGRSSRGTWLYRVALNTALQERRSRETRRAARLDEDAPVRGPRPRRPDQELEDRRRLDRLYAAMDRLEETDRALVVLYLEEKSYREMAEVLGISESYVGEKLHRIRKQLAEWMERDQEDA